MLLLTVLLVGACGGGGSEGSTSNDTNLPTNTNQDNAPNNPPANPSIPGNLLVVDPGTGNDDNTYAQVSGGTHQWATPERALWGSIDRNTPNASEAAQPGDVIRLADGIYVGQGIQNDVSGQSPRNLAAFTPFNSGTENNPIVLEAANPRGATLQANPNNHVNAVVSNFWDGPGSGRSYFNVRGLVIDWSANEDRSNTFGPGEFAAVKLLGGQHNTIENCDIIGRFDTQVNRGTNWAAIFLQNNQYTTIRNNHIRNQGYNGDGAAIEWYSAPDSLVEYNTISNVDSGFLIKTDQRGMDHKNIIVRYNYVKDVKKKSIMITRHIGSATEPTLIYQNVFANVGASGGMGILDLAQYGTTAYIRIINNSFYAPLIAANINASGQYNYHNLNNFIFMNNILASAGNALINAGGTGGSGNPSDYWISNYNCYQKINGGFKYSFHGADYNSLATWRALGEDANSVDADPLYVNPGNGDLTLQTSSPCLNLGRDLLGLLGSDTNALINGGAYIKADQSDAIGANW